MVLNSTLQSLITTLFLGKDAFKLSYGDKRQNNTKASAQKNVTNVNQSDSLSSKGSCKKKRLSVTNIDISPTTNNGINITTNCSKRNKSDLEIKNITGSCDASSNKDIFAFNFI